MRIDRVILFGAVHSHVILALALTLELTHSCSKSRPHTSKYMYLIQQQHCQPHPLLNSTRRIRRPCSSLPMARKTIRVNFDILHLSPSFLTLHGTSSSLQGPVTGRDLITPSSRCVLPGQQQRLWTAIFLFLSSFPFCNLGRISSNSSLLKLPILLRLTTRQAAQKPVEYHVL